MDHSSLRALVLAALLPLTLLVSCGEEVSLGTDAGTSYDGPLHLAEGEGRHPEAGAAGDVVECNAWGDGGAFHGDVYVEGATSDSPGQAVETAFREGLFLPCRAGSPWRPRPRTASCTWPKQVVCPRAP